MRLKDLLHGQYELLSGDLEVDILGLDNDSRSVANGSLFIAEKGLTVDGHNFIDKAIEAGAQAILCQAYSGGFKPGISYIKVKDTSEYMKLLSERFYKRPWEKLHMVGITGTNGKTSTTYILKSILEAAGKKVGIIGTMGGMIGDKKIDVQNTTPNTLVINKLLDHMNREEVSYSLMEASSHGLALNRIGNIKYEVGVFMNLAKDHLDYHKTVENYYESKKKLFSLTSLANIINIDDSYGRRLYSELDDRVNKYAISIKEDSYFHASNINYHLSGVDYKLSIADKSVDIRLKIPGEFSIYNSLAAAAVANLYGIGLDDIKRGLENIEGVKGRFELIPTNTDYSVIIDFAHTAEGLRQVISAMEDFVEGRKIVVFGAGGNRDRTKRPEMGYVVGSMAELAIVTSDNPRNEDPETIVDDVIEGVKKAGADYKKIVDRKQAIEYALDIAKTGDLILLAGKGHETYTIINGQTIPFDEREIVLNYLKTK